MLANCVAASTSRVYVSGLNQCLTFCREVGIPHPPPPPLQEFVLEVFVALLGTRLSVATLRPYLAGLLHFSFRFGFPTKVAGMHSLGFVLHCLQCSQADRFMRLPRQPITVTTLILLRAYVCRHFLARDAIMLLATIFSAFFSLLRSAGYCSPSQRRFDLGVHLQYSELTLRGRIRAPLLHRLRSLSLHCVTPVAWHTPHLRRLVVCIPGWVILDPGPLGAHPPHGIPFLLRPGHPLLLHWGRVCCGCHGLLLGHDPGPSVTEAPSQASDCGIGGVDVLQPSR